MGELRKDPILGRWVIIATERSKRPGSYLVSDDCKQDQSIQCPFCYGNEKMTPPETAVVRDPQTEPNSQGWQTRVVPNKFPIMDGSQPFDKKNKGIFEFSSNFGRHEVVIETPHHCKEIDNQTLEDVQTWMRIIQDRVEQLYLDEKIKYVLVFKNKGKEAGASLMHPHHQIIATPVTPKRVREELLGSELYFNENNSCVFCDMIKDELKQNERVVEQTDNFICLCPYASRFPFEMIILPKKHSLDIFEKHIKDNLAELSALLQRSIKRLTALIGDVSYNYIFHTSPNRIKLPDHWKHIEKDFHLHIEIFPRVTKTAGFEWGTGFYSNPTSPEEAAKDLREVKYDI
ncbi:MAG: galactose-1-phosphate uridylyltransferase [Candidatus Omnitrophica bacterium]|nr:galactose-1-phosphate uridylyltransferase [Candidatus Omnitrophota bacterium]